MILVAGTDGPHGCATCMVAPTTGGPVRPPRAFGTGGSNKVKGLVSTAASRAWLAVVAVGIVVVAVVFGLQLVPRLTAGQKVIDAARPALTDDAVKGELAASRARAAPPARSTRSSR